jgi:hypothetical protein
MMQGVFAFAASNKSLTLFAPTPTYISSNSIKNKDIKVIKRIEKGRDRSWKG